jgi:hypothetical protein
MATKKATATNERIATSFAFRTEASKPGAIAMTGTALAMGLRDYGNIVAVVATARSGVRPQPGDPGPEIAVTGMYTALGDGKTVSITFDTPPNSFGSETVSGQMLLSNDFKSGYATFTVSSKKDYVPTTAANVKVSVGREEYKG